MSEETLRNGCKCLTKHDVTAAEVLVDAHVKKREQLRCILNILPY